MKLANKLKLFSVRDNRLGTFGPPRSARHVGEVLREWEDVANDPNSQIFKHASDFSLYEIGEFDVDTGESVAISPHLLSNASDVKKYSNSINQ